jgi:hypothetical protein
VKGVVDTDDVVGVERSGQLHVDPTTPWAKVDRGGEGGTDPRLPSIDVGGAGEVTAVEVGGGGDGGATEVGGGMGTSEEHQSREVRGCSLWGGEKHRRRGG